jgi:hypothetical protein
LVFSDKLEEPEEEIDYSKIREAIEKAKNTEILICSQASVINRLKHPKSAKFPCIDDRFISVTEVETDRYIVVSYVESENDSGDTIQTFYTCVVILSENGKYEVEDLDFGKRFKIRTEHPG